MRRLLLILFITLHHEGLFAQSGEALFTEKLCHTCHGSAGKKPMAPNWPKICGQQAAYLSEQAIYIRDGKRKTPMAASMRALVSTVTDSEFQKIAEYLEKACLVE